MAQLEKLDFDRITDVKERRAAKKLMVCTKCRLVLRMNALG